MKLEFLQHIFEKSSNIKYHENPLSGSQVLPFGLMGAQADMAKLLVTFNNFANAPIKTSYNVTLRRIRVTIVVEERQ